MSVNLKIAPRFVRQDKDGLRLFQKQTLEAIKNSNAQLIFVEAPVGAGKSYIIRRIVEDENLSSRPIILTYPTKILMNAQVSALKREVGGVKHWPDEPEISGEITLFEYSSDALVRYLKSNPQTIRLDKSDIIHQVLKNHQFSARCNIIVTTPDVLHLIKKGWYRGSRRLRSLLNGAVVVFDEFHLYTCLSNFVPLIEWLIDNVADKIILLSATVTTNEEMEKIIQKYPVEIIDFDSSLGGEKDRVFNYPLELYIEECSYTKIKVMLEKLKQYLSILPKPTAVIFDSIFRLRHIKPVLEKEFGKKYNILEYSGMMKDTLQLDNRSVILGTASVEVGVEMPIKSIIIETSYWTSAIQRLGRVGRFEPGVAVLLCRRRLSPFLKERDCLSRKELEEEVLGEALKERVGTMVSGEMFRGDSFSFIVIDRKTNLAMPYSEAIFAMFDIEDDFVSYWQIVDSREKERILKEDYRLPDAMVEDLFLRDKISPFWGVVSGRLKAEYENVVAKITDEGLHICLDRTGKTYYFEKGKSYE